MAKTVGPRHWLGCRLRLVAVFCISLGLLGSMAWLASARAEDNQVTIGVGDTILSVSGLTSPNGFVVIMDNHNVIGTTVADSYGSYTKDFSAFTAGIHWLSAYARDTHDRLTDTVELEVSVAEHAQTNVGIFLPPTLSIANPTVNRGERVHLTGSTLANGHLSITLDDNIYLQAQANALGEWSYDLDTTALSAGSHSLYVIATEQGSGRQSYPTGRRTITVKAEPVPPLPVITPPGQQPGQYIPPPVITYPSPGSTVTDSQLIVRGTAQPGTQIELFNGEHSIGSTFTDRWGNWRISIALTEPEYLIKARACKQALCSKFSEGVRFFYRRPEGIGDFTAYLERYRYVSQSGESVALQLHIRGGRGPYHIAITWCGGRQETFSTNQSVLTLNHTYRNAGQCIGRITIEEQGGRSVDVDFCVLVIGCFAFSLLWLFLLLLLLLLILLLLKRHQDKKQKHTVNKKS